MIDFQFSEDSRIEETAAPAHAEGDMVLTYRALSVSSRRPGEIPGTRGVAMVFSAGWVGQGPHYPG